jgi:hypothetical protein
LGVLWTPLLGALPLLALAISLTLIHAAKEGLDVHFVDTPRSRIREAAARCLVAGLHIAQPLARLVGRLDGGLTAWRRRGTRRFVLPRPRATAHWTEDWRDPAVRLEEIARGVQQAQNILTRGGDYDRWDLEVFGGTLGSARLLMAIEDHGAGTQYVRLRCWPRVRAASIILLIFLAALGAGAALASHVALTGGFVFLFVLVLAQTVMQCGSAMAALRDASSSTGNSKTGSVAEPEVAAATSDEVVSVK